MCSIHHIGDWSDMRRLDFLVPVYNEGEDVLRPLLDSIAIQQNVNLADDVGVVVCCDGGTTELSDEFASRYPFAIEFHMCEHGGVSATRNACLDHSEAEYVIFADCDDMLCDACGLALVFREMDAAPNPQELAMNGMTAEQVGVGFDTMVSVFREETHDPDGNTVYINRDNDSTFVHGKVHRRQYLIDNNLRFNPSLTIHEDSFFNILCRECAMPMRAKYCPMPWYLWKWRDDSVCRHDPKYILKTFGNMIDSNDALLDELVRRRMLDKANFYCVMMVWDSYYSMNKPEWKEVNNKAFRNKFERRFAEYFRKHRDKWDSMDWPSKMQVSNLIRNRMVSEGMQAEAVTIDGWLKRIQKRYGK